MKPALAYIEEFDPALERLDALITRAQRDAYAEGARHAAVQMFAIAEQADQRVKTVVDPGTDPCDSMDAK